MFIPDDAKVIPKLYAAIINPKTPRDSGDTLLEIYILNKSFIICKNNELIINKIELKKKILNLFIVSPIKCMHKKLKKFPKKLAFIYKTGYNIYDIKIEKGREQKSRSIILKKWRNHMANIEEKVESLVKKKIESLGYELYDVLYIKEGKDYTLRIVIDNEKGIGLDDCEKVNNEITDMLDEADYIKDGYFLEVSSPGIERLLRKDWQLKKYIGEDVEINLFKKDENGFKEYVGTLKNVDEDYLEIEDEKSNKYNIYRKNISQVKTIYKEEK